MHANNNADEDINWVQRDIDAASLKPTAQAAYQTLMLSVTLLRKLKYYSIIHQPNPRIHSNLVGKQAIWQANHQSYINSLTASAT
jgi:hypothetical protein